MQLNPNCAELVTAATNVPPCVSAIAAATLLADRRKRPSLRAGLWATMFASLAVASGFGVAAHGLALDDAMKDRCWCFINAAMALTIACFATGTVLDGWSEIVARRLLPLSNTGSS